ncbi:MAG TPA: cytochrome d ubiquinol oxidase subunit II [Gaiellaceae bacterium]|nr:cytochrome d ubiquinol oxidase subunit II [Gaiellaceae bacterium]
MHLYALPLLFALAGLIFYMVLGGADFGVGWWQLVAARRRRDARLREHLHHAIAPVWEANHVWLIFVLTVVWTAYPVAFESIATTLSIPLFIAVVGIVLRGTAYALRSGSFDADEVRPVDTVFSLSSILTPFALGAAVGGVASRRVPVGNAAGSLFSSWLNPTSILIGTLAVAASAYLAAVFLAADTARIGDRGLEEDFRARALGAGFLAGAIALGGIAVLHSDAHPLFHRLVEGRGIAALVVSVAAGLGTLALVAARRYEPARYSAALAVAAIVAGWALAQSPLLLRGLTVEQAAASHDTLVAVVIAVVAGGVVLFPSLALLFRLVLRGTFDLHEAESTSAPGGGDLLLASRARLLGRLAGASLLGGIGFLTIADAGWAHAIGAVCLFAFVIFGYPAALPADM